MLWQIVNTPHRLLGSAHVLPPNTKLPDWFPEGHRGIERFVFESDVRQPPSSQLGIDLKAAHLKLPGASDVYNRAKMLLAKNGIREPIEALLPWKAAFFVTAIFLPKFGFFHEFGVDSQLSQKADVEKLAVDFLESRIRSSELIDSSCKNADGGLAYFKRVVADAESGAGKLELQRVTRAWMSSDLGDLAAVYAENYSEFPFIVNCTIQRNKEWVSPASRMASERIPTLFIVGSFHTVGTGSFIEQMESAGFRFKFVG